MAEMAEAFKIPNNEVSYDAILANLRDSIRKELNLEPVSDAVRWFRFERNKPAANKTLNQDAPDSGTPASYSGFIIH